MRAVKTGSTNVCESLTEDKDRTTSDLYWEIEEHIEANEMADMPPVQLPRLMYHSNKPQRLKELYRAKYTR